MCPAQVKYTADVGREGAGTKAGFFGDATFTADVRAAFAGVPRVKPQWRKRFMKVMVVGESGLGARARLPHARLCMRGRQKSRSAKAGG